MDRRGMHVRGIVTGLLQKIEKSSQGKGRAVSSAWIMAAGKEAGGHSRAVNFKKGVLTVIVENSAWMYQLTFEKKKIIEEFNKNYTGRGKAAEIRFRQGDTNS
ncbi:MAG: DUF721 domain-containing protein [Candidatus Omnitrophota bacterium]